MPHCFDEWRMEIIARLRIENTRARTPPNLLGIHQRITYVNRKYHSGLIWVGVLRGFAGIKLSGSYRSGENKTIVSRISIMRR